MPAAASTLLSPVLLAAWLVLGLLIARRSHAAGTVMLWMVVFGPLGLLLVAYGEHQRARLGSPPEGGPDTPELFVPVEVHTESGWVAGTLHHWTLTAQGWHGWVTFDRDGTVTAEWFTSDAVRRGPGESPAPRGPEEPRGGPVGWGS
jgi:hypothetical protein